MATYAERAKPQTLSDSRKVKCSECCFFFQMMNIDKVKDLPKCGKCRVASGECVLADCSNCGRSHSKSINYSGGKSFCHDCRAADKSKKNREPKSYDVKLEYENKDLRAQNINLKVLLFGLLEFIPEKHTEKVIEAIKKR